MDTIKNIVFRFMKSGEINTSIEYLFIASQLPNEVHYLLKSNYFAFRFLFNDFEDYKVWLKNTYGDKLPIKMKDYLK
jgi:hypothetical protein